MSSANETDIETLLERWSDAKVELAEIEKRIEKYKRLANKIMNNRDGNTISSYNHTLKRKDMSRTSISKQDVPDNIWEKYARKNTYTAYYLTKNK